MAKARFFQSYFILGFNDLAGTGSTDFTASLVTVGGCEIFKVLTFYPLSRQALAQSKMEPPKFTFDILPGESIGPFSLGMTRGQVREIAQRELGIDIDAYNADAPTNRGYDLIGETGLVVDYDESGCSKCVWARWGPAHSNASAFVLFDKDIPGMDDKSVIELCKSHWSDISQLHHSIEVPSAGLSFTYWDSATWGDLCAVSVEPKRTNQ